METGAHKYRAFVTAVDTGSFAAAAQAMDYSISSVSRMVADLEAECGLSLLERGHAGVIPTTDGNLLLPHARQVLAECDRFTQAANDIAGVEAGTVRIGTFSSVATYWLPPVLREFSSLHPAIDFELLMGDYNEIESWIHDGRVDLGFLREPACLDFARVPVVGDRLVAVVPRGHRKAKARKFPVKDFEREPFIALERDGDTEGAALLQEHGIQVAPAYSIWDDYAIMAMIESGLGLALLPLLIMRRNPFDVVPIPLDVPADRTVWAVWEQGRALSSAAAAFVELVRERAECA